MVCWPPRVRITKEIIYSKLFQLKLFRQKYSLYHMPLRIIIHFHVSKIKVVSWRFRSGLAPGLPLAIHTMQCKSCLNHWIADRSGLYARSFTSCPAPFVLMLHWNVANIGIGPNFSGVSFSKHQVKVWTFWSLFLWHPLSARSLVDKQHSPSLSRNNFCIMFWDLFVDALAIDAKANGLLSQKKKYLTCCGTFPGLPRKILNNADLFNKHLSCALIWFFKPYSLKVIVSEIFGAAQNPEVMFHSFSMGGVPGTLKNPFWMDVWCNNHFASKDFGIIQLKQTVVQ